MHTTCTVSMIGAFDKPYNNSRYIFFFFLITEKKMNNNNNNKKTRVVQEIQNEMGRGREVGHGCL